jgi:hypothetical protein
VPIAEGKSLHTAQFMRPIVVNSSLTHSNNPATGIWLLLKRKIMAKLITTVVTPHIVAVVRYEYDPPRFCIRFFKDGVYQSTADYETDDEINAIQMAESVCHH